MKRFISKILFGFDVLADLDRLRQECNDISSKNYDLRKELERAKLEAKVARMYANDDAAVDELLDYKRQQLRDMSVIEMSAANQMFMNDRRQNALCGEPSRQVSWLLSVL